MSSQPLLPGGSSDTSRKHRGVLTTILVPILLIAGVIYVSIRGESVPRDPLGLANYYLKSSPLIDGHIDLPELARMAYGNNVTAMHMDEKMVGHFDIPRARRGHLGGFFWSIFTECVGNDEDFLEPTNSVRNTLEQIDVSLNLIEKYSDTFTHCKTADEVMEAIGSGKIASLFGVEGGHSLGNSLGVLRVLHQLGVRYMTLTHSCNNAFADSGGIWSTPPEKWGGLSPLGEELVKEMNRIGILIDLSHVSDKTALQALELTRAPVILSHSASRHFHNISRNVPDTVLDKIGRSKHKTDAVVMVNFYPAFTSDTAEADVAVIADHVEYIADRTSRHHVGIGSDFDGIETVPKNLEDVSMYPNLFATLITRGWGQDDLAALAGGNLLRVMRGMEETSRKIQKEGKGPSMAKYSKRTDL